MSFWKSFHRRRFNHLFGHSQRRQEPLTRALIFQTGFFLVASGMLLDLALISPAWADGVFHDHCGQGDCVREWVDHIIPMENGKVAVTVTFAEYQSGDEPVKFSDISKEHDVVSCKKGDEWVTMKVYADSGESKTPPDKLDAGYTGNDRTHLWNAVCLGKYITP